MVKLKKFSSGFLNIVSWLEEAFLCLLLGAMIILACVQIFFRFFFAGGFTWAEPLLRYLVLWAGLFGASVATRQGKHITIDILSHLLPENLKPWLQAALNLFAAAVCAILTYAAVSFVRDEAMYGGRGVLMIPSWAMNLVFPIAFGFISLRFLIQTFHNFGFIFSYQPNAD